MGNAEYMGSVVNIKQLSRFKMNQIILIFAFFGSAVLCEEVARKPKLFFVSTSATTSTMQTASICYVTSATVTTCTGRKRRTISLDGMEPEGAVQPSTFKREVEGESVKQDEVSSKVNGNREGRFLLYWITTTSISTSTSFTITYSVSSAVCTPAGANECG